MIEGLLGKKLGMTQIFDETGQIVPVTVLEVGPCVVTQVKTMERDGYEALQLGFGERKAPQRAGARSPHGVGCLFEAILREVATDEVSAFSVGQVIDCTVFEAGEIVDVTGTSKGKGFAGVVKRHNFRGPKDARSVRPSSCSWFDRRQRDSEPRHQGYEDGRPDGERACHGAEPDRRSRRSRPKRCSRAGLCSWCER